MNYVTSITLDGKRIRIDSTVPRHDVSWYMGRVHVGTSDEAVKADIVERCKGPGYTAGIVRQTVAYALWCHRKNQGLYRSVMRVARAYREFL